MLTNILLLFEEQTQNILVTINISQQTKIY